MIVQDELNKSSSDSLDNSVLLESWRSSTDSLFSHCSSSQSFFHDVTDSVHNQSNNDQFNYIGLPLLINTLNYAVAYNTNNNNNNQNLFIPTIQPTRTQSDVPNYTNELIQWQWLCSQNPNAQIGVKFQSKLVPTATHESHYNIIKQLQSDLSQLHQSNESTAHSMPSSTTLPLHVKQIDNNTKLIQYTNADVITFDNDTTVIPVTTLRPTTTRTSNRPSTSHKSTKHRRHTLEDKPMINIVNRRQSAINIVSSTLQTRPVSRLSTGSNSIKSAHKSLSSATATRRNRIEHPHTGNNSNNNNNNTAVTNSRPQTAVPIVSNISSYKPIHTNTTHKSTTRHKRPIADRLSITRNHLNPITYNIHSLHHANKSTVCNKKSSTTQSRPATRAGLSILTDIPSSRRLSDTVSNNVITSHIPYNKFRSLHIDEYRPSTALVLSPTNDKQRTTQSQSIIQSNNLTVKPVSISNLSVRHKSRSNKAGADKIIIKRVANNPVSTANKLSKSNVMKQ